MRANDVGVVLGGLCGLVFFGWLTAVVVVNITAKNRCAELGYTYHKVTPNFARYCVAREQQTDVVLPLADAEKRPRR